MFCAKTIFGDLCCDRCGKILKSYVSRLDAPFKKILCKECEKNVKRLEEEERNHPLKVGDKVAFGINDRIYVGVVYKTYNPDSHDILKEIATAKYDKNGAWHISLEEMSNPIGGNKCWTRKLKKQEKWKSVEVINESK